MALTQARPAALSQFRDAARALAAMPAELATAIDVVASVESGEREAALALIAELAREYGLRYSVTERTSLNVRFERGESNIVRLELRR